MIYAEFIRFYGYTAEEALQEYAKRFFALANSMYRVSAGERLKELSIVNAGVNGGKGADSLVSDLKKQLKGNEGVLNEVRNIK